MGGNNRPVFKTQGLPVRGRATSRRRQAVLPIVWAVVGSDGSLLTAGAAEDSACYDG